MAELEAIASRAQTRPINTLLILFAEANFDDGGFDQYLTMCIAHHQRNELLNFVMLLSGSSYGDDAIFRVGNNRCGFAESVALRDRRAFVRYCGGIGAVINTAFCGDLSSAIAGGRLYTCAGGRSVGAMLDRGFAGTVRQNLVGLTQDVFDVRFQSLPEVVLRRVGD